LKHPLPNQPSFFTFISALLFFRDTSLHGEAIDDSRRRDEENGGEDMATWSPLTLKELNRLAPLWKEYKQGYLAGTPAQAKQWFKSDASEVTPRDFEPTTRDVNFPQRICFR
jgi:hypothetical protein